MTIEIGKKFNKILAYVPITGAIEEIDETCAEFMAWCKGEKIKVHRLFVEPNLIDYPILQELKEYIEENDLVVLPTLDGLFKTSGELLEAIQNLCDRKCSFYARDEDLFLNFFDPSEKQKNINETTLLGIRNAATFEDSIKLIRMRKDLLDRKLSGKRIANRFVLSREAKKEIVAQKRAGIKVTEIAKHYCISNDKVMEVITKQNKAELSCCI